MRGAAVVFFAYMGFDAVATAAQEAKNPQRDLPIGILGSLAGCAVLYMLVAIVLTGLVPYTALDVPDPIAVGVDATGLRWLSPLVKLGAIAGLSTVILVGMLAQSRIFYTMAHDGLLPPWVGQLHPRYRTPHRITLVTGAGHGGAGGAHADRRARRAGEHGHAAHVRDRVRRHHHPAAHAARSCRGPSARRGHRWCRCWAC